MRNKLILIVAIFMPCVFANPVLGQTASEIEGKYGKPVKAYSVSEHIWMTPEFTDDGQVCEMRLYPKRISANTNYLGDKLPFWELKEVLNRLSPRQSRGEKTAFFNFSNLGGGLARTLYAYDKVTIVFYTSIGGYWEPVTEDTSVEKKTENDVKLDDEFPNPFVRDAEIVVVGWNNRKCAKR